MRPLRDFEKGDHEVEERHDGKSHHEAARRGQEHAEATAEARKNGKSHRPHRKIQPHGDGAALAAEIFEGKENAEDLQGERHRRRNGDKGANSVERHRKRDIGDIAGIQLFQYVFFHIDIISRYPAI